MPVGSGSITIVGNGTASETELVRLRRHDAPLVAQNFAINDLRTGEAAI